MPETAQLSDAKRKLLRKYLQGRMEVSSESRTIPRRATDEAIPLSYAQEQVWLHAQMASDIPLYNETITIYRRGPLDVAVLEQCLVEIVRRHEIWRSTFDVVGDEPVQAVHPAPGSFPLRVADLRALSESEREAEAVRLASEDVQRKFDMAAGPLLRALLVSMDDQQHRLYMTFHHLIFDAVTAYQVFLPELEALYEALSAGRPSPLAEPRVQYADFACWQRKQASSQIWEEDLKYWRHRLGGALPSCPWPSDRPRPPIETHRGTVQRFAIDEDLSRKIRVLSRQTGVSVFTTLMTGLAAVLHRYTNENELVIGTLTAGRTRTELKRVMGYFVNPLALRVDCSGNPSFHELQTRVRKTLSEGLAHEQVPFVQVVKEVQPKHDPSRNPLFQIILSQQPQVQHVAPGWEIISEEISNGGSKLDLLIVIDDRGATISGPITYNPDLFDAATIERLVGHWQTLLEGACEDPEIHISKLPILTNGERRQLLVEWNETGVEFHKQQTLHQWFERQAQSTPDAVAVTGEGKHLTYSEINRRANQVAHYLRKAGVGPDVLVGLFLERSVEIVIGILGILKAGGAYLPIDPVYPADRLRFMLGDAYVPVLLTQAKLAAELGEHGARVVCVDRDARFLDREPHTNPPQSATPNNLAYVIYTSGSTGQPKGTRISHYNVVRLMQATEQWYHFNEHDVWTLFHSHAFDFSVWELWGALLYGGRLVIVPHLISRSPEEFYKLLVNEGVTVLNQTPSAFIQLIEAEVNVGASDQLALRYVIFGGEALKLSSLKLWFDRHGDIRPKLVNMYGITETTVHVTYRPLSAADLESGSVVGVPIPDMQVYILDKYQEPVPIGVPGEIYVGGAGVAQGYLNREELTRARFLTDRFANKPGALVYRTGDVARYLSTREIEYLGRNDNQVKIRGYRIELGEIEAVLGRHDAVRQCLVTVLEVAKGDKRLVAYLESRPGATIDVAELRAHLKKFLPDHMVPSIFAPVSKFPLTANGKIDRQALPKPQQEHVGVLENFVAARDALEQALVLLWSKVLGVKRVGIHDNFFELGGHSLTAVRLIVEIEKAFHKRLPLATLLQAPTIRDLADVLRKQNWKPSWQSLVPVRAGGSKPPLFLMHSHGGNILEYLPLANHLDEQQPVYALQARGLDGHIVKGRSVEDMARTYLAEIRSLQPEGPYYLGGYCSGGVLAWEAARQLVAAGEQVALLVMIQTFHPACVSFRSTATIFHRCWYRTKKRIDLERESFSIRGKRHIFERCRRAIDILRARTTIAFDNAIGNGHDRSMSTTHILERLAIEHNRARDQYVPSCYNGDVVLFRASKQLSGLVADFSLGWKDLVTGKLDISELPGHQETMLSEPNVVRLAEELTARLHAAQQPRTLALEESVERVLQ